MGTPLRPFIRCAHVAAWRGFTLIELLLVMVVILILVGIVLALAGPARNRAARALATTQVQALRSALERYKVDNAVYPSSDATNALDPKTNLDPTATGYAAASRDLYALLTSQLDTTGKPLNPATYPPPVPASGAKIYFAFKAAMMGGTKDSAGTVASVTQLNDPWANSFGYSTIYQNQLENNAAGIVPTQGYSPGYDLWSTAGKTGTDSNPQQWVTTW